MESLQDELDEARKSLSRTEEKLRKLEELESRKAEHQSSSHPTSLLDRLRSLNDAVESLELVRELSQWRETIKEVSPPTLGQDSRRCTELAAILCRHARHGLLVKMFQDEYQPLYRYVRAQLLLNIRQSLRRIKYPSDDATVVLVREVEALSDNDETVSAYMVWLTRVQIEHQKLQAHIDGTPLFAAKLESVVELCRPLVERVSFHFLQPSEDRLSSTRIDRLPEWLFNYVRKNIFEGGPWDFVGKVASILQMEVFLFQFLNEICQLTSFVLAQRNFFRHDKIVGWKSNPILLAGAIEQLLSFDTYIRELVRLEVYPLGLSQFHIAEDEELFLWFLNHELEWAISTLFDTPVSTETSPRRISPRAELFCALIYSIMTKASVFATPSRYIAHVGVPLCQHFLDAIHESSIELRGLLTQRRIISSEDLEKNLECWMELINGTHMAAIRLNQGTARYQVDHDLSRVGRSMDRLRDALVDECSSTLVDTVIMERAKLASYLLRASHVLALEEAVEENSDDISPDLQESLAVFSKVLRVCVDIPSSKEQDELKSIISFAPMAIRSNVTDRMADKLLEVALDAHGMTPDIELSGAKTFHRDVRGLFGSPPLPPLAMRLLDVTTFMSMDNKPFQEMKLAISGLLHQTPVSGPLLYEEFVQDGTLLDEAVLMVRAKGYTWIHLEDVVSILNRRQR
jgi:hypothetical protein